MARSHSRTAESPNQANQTPACIFVAARSVKLTVWAVPTEIHFRPTVKDLYSVAMISATRLGVQGFAFGIALTSGSCMPQNQDEIAQLRAELSALKTEVATLKSEQAAPASNPALTEVAAKDAGDDQSAKLGPDGASPAASAPAGFNWDEAIAKHDKDKRDLTWSRLREPALVAAAKEHIKPYGASLNTARCKEDSCVLTINVPKKPKAAYEPMANPWAQSPMYAQSKPIYSGRVLWTYLLPRHEKDTKEAGAERVNPAELAKQHPELVQPTIVLNTTEAAQKPAAASASTGTVSPAKTETKGTGAKATEPKPAETKATETKAIALKPETAKALETKSLAVKPAAAKAPAKPAETKAESTKALASAQPAEPKSTDKAVGATAVASLAWPPRQPLRQNRANRRKP